MIVIHKVNLFNWASWTMTQHHLKMLNSGLKPTKTSIQMCKDSIIRKSSEEKSYKAINILHFIWGTFISSALEAGEGNCVFSQIRLSLTVVFLCLNRLCMPSHAFFWYDIGYRIIFENNKLQFYWCHTKKEGLAGLVYVRLHLVWQWQCCSDLFFAWHGS